MEKEITLKIQYSEHDKIILKSKSGDTYTSKSEDLQDFLLSCEVIPAPSNGWVDVKDRLPEKDDFLIFSNGVVSKFENSFHLVKIWLKGLKVTHWKYCDYPNTTLPVKKELSDITRNELLAIGILLNCPDHIESNRISHADVFIKHAFIEKRECDINTKNEIFTFLQSRGYKI